MSMMSTELGGYTSTPKWGKDLIVDINAAIKGMHNEMKDLKLSMNTQIGDILEAVRDLKTHVIEAADLAKAAAELASKNQTKIERYERSLAKLSQENSNLKSRMMYIDSKERRFNLIFKGVPEVHNESDLNRVQSVKKIFTENMGIQIDAVASIRIINCVRANGQKLNGHRPICVSFGHAADRSLIWNARSKLKNSDYFVCEDYALEVELQRRQLFQILNIAKTLDGYKDNTNVNFDKLICYGKAYTCSTLHLLPAPLNPRTVSQRSSDDVILFGGPNSKHHPFSNWFKTDDDVVYQQMNFSSSEQAFLYQKAKFAKDDIACENIYLAEDPSDAKHYSHKIRNLNFGEWNKRKEGIMKDILKVKFRNTTLAKLLKDTGAKHLAEAGKDDSWATGIPLYNKSAFDKKKWSGKNLLGKILMEVRDELNHL